MKVNRAKLLSRLKLASRGLSMTGMVEHSDCFLFHEGKVTTFSGEVCVQVKDLCGLDGSVSSKELLSLIERFPDDELEVTQEKGGEIQLKAKRRSAGIVCQRKASLDPSEVPKPKDWFEAPESLSGDLESAAKVCGRDETLGATTCVRIQAKRVEACDNFRGIRIDRDTGVKGEVFISSRNVEALKDLRPEKVALDKGWIHFRVVGGIISLRTREFDEYPDLTPLLEESGDIISLPNDLISGIDRAVVTTEVESYATRVSVAIKPGEATVSSSSGKGWYEETFSVTYEGPPMDFTAHPDSLAQILGHSFSLRVDAGRLVAHCKPVSFVVAIEARPDDA